MLKAKEDGELHSNHPVDLRNKAATEPNRSTWGKQIEFTLSCVGYSVGIGNLWRFPYLCMRNGGGAFLIPYFTFLLLCGLPLFLLELVLGQFSSSGCIDVWSICPLFSGLGWGAIVATLICTIYFNAIIGWALYYLGMSFTKDLPWKTCNNSWNTENCFVLGSNSVNMSQVEYDKTNITMASKNLISAAEEFFHNRVLDLSDGIEDIGPIKWDLMICLFVAGLSLYLCIFKGVKSTGKVVYFTATIPYLFLIILLVRGLTLPGSLLGVKFYIIPDWNRLKEFKVWAEACLQIFFSLGPAWGGLITMSSYSKFNNNCVKDAVVTCLSCGLTSFFGGFVIFSVIGFMAYDAGVPIEKVITQGPGLAFIAYPQAIGKMPLAPFWAVCFFLMLFFLGLDSQFVCLEVAATSFIDLYPAFLRPRRVWFLAGVSIVCFLLGLPLVTRGGMYMFQIIDWYVGMIVLFIISLLDCIIISYVYGLGRIFYDMTLMFKKPPSIIWAVLWAGVTPTILFAMLLYSLGNVSPPYYGNYTYPSWAIGLGWCIALSSVIPIPGVAIYKLIKAEGTLKERFIHLLKPDPSWGPRLAENREAYKYNLHQYSWSERFFIQNRKPKKFNVEETEGGVPEKIPLQGVDVNNQE